MAITVEKHELTYSPYYNDNRVFLLSDNINLKRFRYLIEINVEGQTIQAYTQAGQSGIGNFEFNNIIKDFIWLEKNFDLDSTTDDGGKHFVEYSWNVKEQYVKEWSATIVADTGGNVTLEDSSAHHYSVNDLIRIDSNSAEVKSGVYRVIDVPSSEVIVINQPFTASTTTADITTRYADNRLFTSANQLTTKTNVVFDARFDFVERVNFNDDNLVVNDSNGRLISGLPLGETIKMTRSQLHTINYITTSENAVLNILRNGDPFDTINIDERGTIPIGAGNYSGLLDSNVWQIGDVIRFQIENPDESTVSTFYDIQIVEDPCSKFETKQVVWLGRYGEWKSMLFELHSSKELDVEKTLYERENFERVVDPIAKTIDWSITDFGEKVTHTKRNEVYNINRNRMSQFEINYVEDLFYSRYVYVDGLPVILQVNNYVVEDLLHRRRKTLGLSYTLSNKNK